MAKRLKNLADIKEYLEGKIADLDVMVDNVVVEHKQGLLPEFLRYRALGLVQATFHADEARKYLKHVAMETKRDGSVYTDEQKFDDIAEEVRAYVLQRLGSRFSDDGRSSSASLNLSKDAVADFFIEFFQRFNEGY